MKKILVTQLLPCLLGLIPAYLIQNWTRAATQTLATIEQMEGTLTPLVKEEANNIYTASSVKDGHLLYPANKILTPTVFHLFSHGKAGSLLLDGHWKTAPQIADWLQEKGYIEGKTHLNIYGCHFAKGKKGRAAVEYLQANLGISIAASDNITGVDGDWELEIGTPQNVLTIPAYSHNLQCGAVDDFDSAGYSGGTDWSGNWIEVNDDNSAATGLIESDGSPNYLEFDGTAGTNPYIYRCVDLSNASSATLDFELLGALLESADELEVEISTNGGSSWTNLTTYTGTQLGTKSINISSYLTATTCIRFGISANTTGPDEFFYIDNVEVSASCNGGNPTGSITCTAGATEINGTVFEDCDYDGLKSTYDVVGISSVLVTATDSLGNTFTTNTDTNGTYSFTGLLAGRTYRIEFTNLPSWATPTTFGGDNGTTVQFLQASNCSNLGLAQALVPPASNALVNTYGLVATCGADDVSDHVMGLDNVLDLNYSTSTYSPAMFMHSNWTVQTIGNIYYTEFDMVGNIYGTASKFTSKGALGEFTVQQFGSLGGSGTVYQFDAITGAPSVWATLPQEGNTDVNDDSGLGGISYDPKTNSMYVVNMFDNKIYKLNGTTGAIDSVYYPDPVVLGTATATTSSGDAITNFQARPFGLDIFNGRLYYTVIDATGAGSLVVRSVALDSNGDMVVATDQEEINFVLPNPIDVNNTYQADPMVADIDFSRTGKMAVGTFSTGSTWEDGFSPSGRVEASYYAFGSTKTLYNHVAGNHIFELSSGTWTRTAVTTVGQETFGSASPNGTSTGGLAWDLDPDNQGGDEVLWMSGGDFDDEDSNWGIIGYNEAQLDNNFTQENATEYIQFLFDPIESTGDPKGNGGDVDVFFTKIQPLEIGNYVWLDADSDGIQDPGEVGMEGIRIELYDATGNLVAFDTTDINGQYYFSVDGDGSQVWLTTGDSLDYNMTYYIVAGGGGQYANENLTYNSEQYALTQDSTNSGINRYAIDSDGTIASGIDPDFNGLPYLEITTGGAGSVDHTYDFGFSTCNSPVVSAFAIQPSCDNSASQDDGYLQISAVTSGDKLNFSTGNTYTGPTDYSDGTNLTIGALPFQFNTGLSNADAGDYTIRVFSGASDCFTDVVVTLNTRDSPTATVADVLKCNSDAVNISVSPTGGAAPYSYNWSGPFIPSPVNVDNFSTSIPGTYSVTVTDDNGCITTASGAVTVQPKVCLPVAVTIRKGRRN